MSYFSSSPCSFLLFFEDGMHCFPGSQWQLSDVFLFIVKESPSVMQPGSVRVKSGITHIARRYGMIFGLIRGLFCFLFGMLNNIVRVHSPALVFPLDILQDCFSFALFFLAGWLASSRTARPGTGCIAGVWAGCVSQVIIFVTGALYLLVAQYAYPLPEGSDTMGEIWSPFLLHMVQHAALWVVLGVGLGLFGGLLSSYLERSRTATESEQ